MKFLQTLLVMTLGAAAHCASAAAAPTVTPATAINPLSVHVLDLQDGLPSADVAVTLEQRVGDGWTMLGEGVTNAQGRIPALFPTGVAMVRGTYRVTFKTGKWFAEHKSPTFFPEIPVIFTADGSVPHYHVPLLLSPYGYSTYRGN
ncbi:hydroxyisourate hydrolase [Massilia aurea]|uniref:hydroxyisourate hydrolase n=1 Tax=Massilia aurea TaxID=373040 RepID=UPI00216303BE|nr:hydroxyisourate hydrolase [Massilia aurea]MCS0706862.1 hydroxyisourate hydrolase [Massilia aurea]